MKTKRQSERDGALFSLIGGELINIMSRVGLTRKREKYTVLIEKFAARSQTQKKNPRNGGGRKTAKTT